MNTQIDIPAFNGIIIDDHLLFASGFIELLRTMAPESHVTHLPTIEKGKKIMETGNFEFLFLDLVIPGEDSRAFISYCKKKYPSLIIIIISTIMEISKVKEAFSNGANAYISKAVNEYELKLALERTYNGESYVSSDLNGRLASSFFVADQNDLTSKEMEVLRLIAEGKKVDTIAQDLCISSYTVMAHRRNIMKKLDLHSAAELVKYAFENKLN